MAGNGRKNADEALLAALAGGATVCEAAAKAGISERTAFRRLADPACRQRVAELRAEMVSRALGRMAEGMAGAADTLRTLLAEEYTASVRLGAARALLELSVKLRESVELEERVAALEARGTNESGP